MEATEITRLILDKCKSFIHDVPSEVQAVYNLAVERFGEENVDLQSSFDIDYLSYIISEMSISFLLEDLNISRESFIEAAKTDYNSMHSYAPDFFDEDNIGVLLGLITEESAKSGRMPIFAVTVRFKDIEVTNEHGSHTHIEEIYSLCHLSYTGKYVGKMAWMRTGISREHYFAGYIHSHLPSGSTQSFRKWITPCLGQGPINMTINNLRSGFEESLWMLYWVELDLCIHTESLAGGPYFKLETIVDRQRTLDSYFKWTEVRLKDRVPDKVIKILQHLLELKQIKWVWDTYAFVPGMPFIELYYLISNAALDVYGQNYPIEEVASFLVDFASAGDSAFYWGQLDNNQVVRLNLSTTDTQEMVTRLNWSFRNEIVTQVVYGIEDTASEKFLFLNYETANLIYNYLILAVNSSYGKFNTSYRNKIPVRTLY